VSAARRVAVDLLGRIENDGAYANLVTPSTLEHARLSQRDRHLVTELVYGTTRMRRACDFLVDRFLLRPVQPDVRTVLRLGAYQLEFTRVPAHAAVDASVSTAPRAARGLVNAVLRRVAESPVEWPDDATRLSYPDWIVERLRADLGAADALAALDQMNRPARPSERPDGYVQDQASQWVADLVGATAGERVADLCAAPGGKATAMAPRVGDGVVIAGDVHPVRTGLVAANVRRLGLGAEVCVVRADGRSAPFRPRSFDRVLVDAPCSGLGALGRRPDARWRIVADDVDRLAGLQRDLLDGAVALLRAEGILVYSVCTMTAAETVAVDEHVATRWPGLVPMELPGAPWVRWGRGALLLPQAAATDGMALFRYRLPADSYPPMPG
jgi:16S rRNA (cytosine967-C5)-methyltransferase